MFYGRYLHLFVPHFFIVNLLSLRVTQTALQFPFFSFILLYSKFGRTGKSCLSNFSGWLSYTSGAQFGHSWKTLCYKYLFLSEISYAKAMCLHAMRYAKHAMCFRESNNGGSKRIYKSGHVNTIKFFIM